MLRSGFRDVSLENHGSGLSRIPHPVLQCMGKECDLVKIVEKVAKWLGKGLVVAAHVDECEDADKDAGEEMDLCTVTELTNAQQPSRAAFKTWDDEDVAAPERQGFFCLYKNQMLISLMPATNL